MDGSKIKQLAVQIINDEGVTKGSGTLFVPNSEGVYAYIFTAAHVLFNKKNQEENLKFKMLVEENEIEIKTNEKDSIKWHEQYDIEADIKKYDVAVIKVTKEEWMRKLPILTIGMPKENEIIEGQGFPNNAYESKTLFARLPLHGSVVTCSNAYKRFQLELTNNLNPNNRDEELIGYSGTGIYEKCDDKIEPVLIGIFSYGQGQQATQSIANSFYSILLLDVCKKHGWEEPEISNQYPTSFEPYLCEAISIIENNNVKNKIKENMKYIIDEGIGPYKLVDSNNDIPDIPKCNGRDRARCKVCWIARLQLISILATLGVEIEELKNPELAIAEGNKIPIDFFCSEGNKGESQMRQVVHSILDKGYAWDNKFRENAILVWASYGNQTHKSMNRTEFNNVIGNICNEPISKKKKYDTMYGEGRTNNLSIIHIDMLMRAIDTKDETSDNNQLLEVLENVIK